MSSTQQLKRRIGSVKNTKQITKAMELVAASKMRRAQEHTVKSREFRNLAGRILRRLSEVTDVSQHPLYRVRAVKAKLRIVITSDRGLAGAYNSNLLRHFTKQLSQDREQSIQTSVIMIGKQAGRIISKLESVDVIAAYDGFSEQPSVNEIRPILNTMIEQFTHNKVDSVEITYTDYKSSISQVVRSQQLLPASLSKSQEDEEFDQVIVEPTPAKVLESVTERLVESQLNQAFNESQASEQAARMVAMKNASDNAGDIIDDLTLVFNTARQAAITQELAEITGGAEAIAN